MKTTPFFSRGYFREERGLRNIGLKESQVSGEGPGRKGGRCHHAGLY